MTRTKICKKKFSQAKGCNQPAWLTTGSTFPTVSHGNSHHPIHSQHFHTFEIKLENLKLKNKVRLRFEMQLFPTVTVSQMRIATALKYWKHFHTFEIYLAIVFQIFDPVDLGGRLKDYLRFQSNHKIFKKGRICLFNIVLKIRWS